MRGKHAPAELAALTNKLANVAVGEIEAVVGPIDGTAGLSYQDDDGGFTCGSTGRPPLGFPWPPRSGFGLEDVIATGALERELVTVLREGKVGIKELLADPHGASAAAGVPLSANAIAQLEVLAPDHLANLADPTAREVATFFHRVLDDGRYLETWSVRPHEVASTLGVKLSDAAIDRIVAGGATVFRPGGGGAEVANAAIGVAIAVGVVIMLVTKDPFRIPIRDASGVRKF